MCSCHCCAAQVLKISVDESIVDSINNALMTKYEKEEVMKGLFLPVRDIAQDEINDLMADFRVKLKLG